jgi:hypothetical protein
MDPTNINLLHQSDFLNTISVSEESQTHKVVWWVVIVIEILLFIRLTMEYLAINPTGALTSGIFTITQYILYPFATIINVSGNNNYGWIAMAAIIGYFLLAIALVKFFKAKKSPHLRIEYARALSRRKYSRS